MSDKNNIIEVDDSKYFVYIDTSIRTWFSSYEENVVLPVAKGIIENSGYSLDKLNKYPIEGYYYKSEALKEVFTYVRNIQQNEELCRVIDVDGFGIKFLKMVYENDLFGIEPKKAYPWLFSPLKRRWDILTCVMSEEKYVERKSHFPFDMKEILDDIKLMSKNRVNLVELAALIGKPELLICGAETNSLGRMYACVSASYCSNSYFIPPTEYVWKVRDDVYELGSKIIDKYNSIMDLKEYKKDNNIYSVYNPYIIRSPSKDNVSQFFWKEMELPRVSHLGYCMKPKLNYFWILSSCGDVYEYYSKELITTEIFCRREFEILKEQYPYLRKYNN